MYSIMLIVRTEMLTQEAREGAEERRPECSDARWRGGAFDRRQSKESGRCESVKVQQGDANGSRSQDAQS